MPYEKHDHENILMFAVTEAGRISVEVTESLGSLISIDVEVTHFSCELMEGTGA